MKILVTGATGFIGRALVKRLAGKHEIYAATRDEQVSFGQEQPLIEHIHVKWNDHISLENAVRGKDVVFHLAGEMFERFWSDFYAANVENTLSLLKACAKASVPKVIFLSSISAGGPSSKYSILNEECEPEPNGLYGKSKLMAEREFERFAYRNGTEVYVIRSPIVYGPSQNVFFSAFLKRVLSGKVTIIGDGKNLRSFCFIENLTDIFERILTLPNGLGGTYYIADEEVFTVNEFVNLVGELGKVKVDILRLPRWISQWTAILYHGLALLGINLTSLFIIRSSTENFACSIDKAKATLGFRPPFSLREGLKVTLEWLTSQR